LEAESREHTLSTQRGGSEGTAFRKKHIRRGDKGTRKKGQVYRASKRSPAGERNEKSKKRTSSKFWNRLTLPRGRRSGRRAERWGLYIGEGGRQPRRKVKNLPTLLGTGEKSRKPILTLFLGGKSRNQKRHPEETVSIGGGRGRKQEPGIVYTVRQEQKKEIKTISRRTGPGGKAKVHPTTVGRERGGGGGSRKGKTARGAEES